MREKVKVIKVAKFINGTKVIKTIKIIRLKKEN